MQMLIVTLSEFTGPKDSPLPAVNRAGNVRKKAQPIIRWHDRYADHVAECHDHEKTFQRRADLERLLRCFVSEHAEQKFSNRFHSSPPIVPRLRPQGKCCMTSTNVIMLFVALFMGWFAAGSIWNVRKGKAVLRWMQGGLPLIGERTTVRWLGTTGVEMSIAGVKEPFDQATLVIFLEPRDVPWIWGPSRARGRRDTLIFRAQLGRPPAVDLEALDPASWSGRDARRRIEAERWSIREPQSRDSLRLFFKTDGAVTLGDALLDLASQAGMTVRRLSVRRGEPHLQVHADLPSVSSSGAEFFQTLRAIAERVNQF